MYIKGLYTGYVARVINPQKVEGCEPFWLHAHYEGEDGCKTIWEPVIISYGFRFPKKWGLRCRGIKKKEWQGMEAYCFDSEGYFATMKM